MLSNANGLIVEVMYCPFDGDTLEPVCSCGFEECWECLHCNTHWWSGENALFTGDTGDCRVHTECTECEDEDKEFFSFDTSI